jgi:hypothetical protein
LEKDRVRAGFKPAPTVFGEKDGAFKKLAWNLQANHLFAGIKKLIDFNHS